MNTISIPKSMFEESSPLAVMLYTTISVYTKYALTTDEYIYMSRDKLQNDLYGEKGHQRFQTDKLMEGIRELEELGFLIYNKERRGVMINRKSFFPDQYVMIHPEDFDAIRNNTEPGYFQWLLFYYFCHMMISLNGHIAIDGMNNIIGFMPETYFAEQMDIGVTTVKEYNKRLQDIKVIYIAHKAKRTKYGNMGNLYCRYANQALLKKYLESD